MKRFFFLLAAFAAAAALTGCNGNIEPAPDPVINISDSTFTALPEGGELTIAYTIQNPVEGGNLTADPADDWMGEAKVSDEAVVFNVEPNEGEQARETTVTLTYVFGDDRNITAEVIVSQDFVQEEPDVPGEDPVIEIVTEEMTIPFAGGECRILYQVKDPVSDGKMSASSDAGWLTGFSCDDNNGVADFTAEANETAETRSATVVLTYTYGGSKTVTAEFDLSQEASDPEAKYNYDYQLSYYFAEYYGNQFTDCHNWVFYLTDTPAEDGMYFPDNAVVYTIDLYAAADPENPENPLPAAGEYRISSDSEDMTFSDFMSYPTIPGYVAMIVDGTVNISYEGTDIIIEGIWTDENNATHHFVFNGPMEVTDMTEPEGPDDPDVPETPDEFNIEAFNYEAEYVNDVDGVMEVDLCFVDMPLDDYGYSYVGPGHNLHVTAFMPFDYDGNIPAGTYTITSEPGAVNTLTPGEIEEWYPGFADGYGAFMEVYDESGYYLTYYAMSEGTMTVSGSAGNYTVECEFTTEDGTPVTCTYNGPIEIQYIPTPYSTLTGDYTAKLEGAVAHTSYTGNYYGNALRWKISLMPADSLNGDGLELELFTATTGTFEEGIPSGTYTASTSTYMGEAFEYIAGYKDYYYGGIYGSNLMQYSGGEVVGQAPAQSGELHITNNGDGTYALSFSMNDDKGNVWDGEWSGELNAENDDWSSYSAAPGNTVRRGIPLTDAQRSQFHKERGSRDVVAGPDAGKAAPAGSIKEYVLKKLGKM